MEFWGVEVKAGQSMKVEPELGTFLHVSQASLGETKKGSESAVLNVKVGGKKFVIGNLSHDKFPQLSFDLVFEKDFELSHNWKNGSVYFIGYKSAMSNDEELSDEIDSDEEEPSLAPTGLVNGKPEKKGDQAAAKAKAAKPESSVKADAHKEDEDEDSEDDDSEYSEDESGSDEEMGDGESDDDSDEDEEDEETPKKVESGKKRSIESATKTPASKKAKANTPEKTDGKKSVHVDTPHPSKRAGKTSGNKPQPQTPKSGGQFSCNSCKKSFNSDMALQSHNKAKHSGQ